MVSPALGPSAHALHGLRSRRVLSWLVLGTLWGCEAREKETRCLVIPDTLDFGPVLLGETAERSLQITNEGETVLDLTILVPAVDFRLADRDTLVANLASGGTVTVPVRFAPSAVGARAAAVEIRGAPCSDVHLLGRGESRECRVEPVALDFGWVHVGEARERSFVVRNTGTTPLEGDIPLGCSDYRVLSGGSSFVLLPGDSLRVAVEFRPVRVGPQTCTLDLGTDLCGEVMCDGDGTRTWKVLADGTGDAPTIQAAIDSSRNGDAVEVGLGTYYENIRFKGKRVHLKSREGPEGTVIDGSRGDLSVVRIVDGENEEAILEGFTITGGRGTPYPEGSIVRYGGGVSCLQAAPTIVGNIITGNTLDVTGYGAGLTFGNLDPEKVAHITGNFVHGNTALTNGGGIGLFGSCEVRMNRIVENQTQRGDGGGIYVNISIPAKMVIEGNEIRGNVAADHGGGIYMGNSGRDDILIQGNLLVGNTARGLGAGVRIRDCRGGGIWMDGIAVIRNNTLAFNRAETPFVYPDAGCICLESVPVGTTVEANLIYKNFGAGVSTYYLEASGVHHAELRRNLIYANTDHDVYVDPGFVLVEEGNLFVDPLLCTDGPETDGSLHANSPALTQDGGVIGAVNTSGCGPVATSVKPGERRPR